MKKINVIGPLNNYGLSRDIKIITKILEDHNYNVKITNTYPYRKLLKIWWILHKLLKKVLGIDISSQIKVKPDPKYDLSIFIEQLQPFFMSTASKNIIFPNQEWFFADRIPYLRAFDKVFCKTKYAENFFMEFTDQVVFSGFTGPDKYDPTTSKNYKGFFHVAGQSAYKGTKRMIEVWEEHPDWPTLTVIQHPMFAVPSEAPNIKHIVTEYYDEVRLTKMQNQHGIHICLSEAEGFGHYIVEAMSCKSVVITTNAPPMNQLVNPPRGFLVDWDTKKQVNLGDNFYFSTTHFERTIEKIMEMDDNSLKDMGENARKWYLENNSFFHTQFPKLIKNVLSD
jgi:hypothetical protein